MQKTVILNASPDKNGHTAYLTDIFMSQFRGEKRIYNMYDENVAPCIDCGVCRETKKCFNDDMKHILRDIFTADYLIFASPVYNYSFPAPMKAFLDRLQPYFFANNSMASRKGFLLVTCGKSGKYSIEFMEKQAKMAFSELSSEFCGSYVFTNTDKLNTLQNSESCKVKNLAAEFFT